MKTTRRKKNPKNKDSAGSLWDNFKQTNIRIITVPKGEEEEQEIENLFENIMKENFPNLVKEAQRVPNKMDPRRNTPRHIIIKIPKIKDKERILKASRERKRLTFKEFPEDCQLISQKTLAG